jgi:hypothetical protein
VVLHCLTTAHHEAVLHHGIEVIRRRAVRVAVTCRAQVIFLVVAGIIGPCVTHPADAAKLQPCQKSYQQLFVGKPSHKAVATSGLAAIGKV